MAIAVMSEIIAGEYADNLPPLPMLTTRQWRALPRHEKDRLRALKKAHKRLANGEPVIHLDSRPSAAPNPRGLHLPQPFVGLDGKPIPAPNIGMGGGCFVVCSGPSLNDIDLSLLNRRGIYTIGVNNSPVVYRPNAWTFMDRQSKFHDGIWCDPTVLKIVNIRQRAKGLRKKNADGTFRPLLLSDFREGGGDRSACVADMPNVLFSRRYGDFNAAKWLETDALSVGNNRKSSVRNGMPKILNVMFCALKTAYSLGFRTVGLLGCDFKMDYSRPYAFNQGKHAGGVNGNNHSYSVLNYFFELLRPHFDAAGFTVYNCTENSGLRAFDFRAYTTLIHEYTRKCSQDPLDASHWYDMDGEGD